MYILKFKLFKKTIIRKYDIKHIFSTKKDTPGNYNLFGYNRGFSIPLNKPV